MARFKATIEIEFEAACESSACDVVSETLRNQMRSYVGIDGWLYDWQYAVNSDGQFQSPTDTQETYNE